MDSATPTPTSINEMRFRLLINSMSDAVMTVESTGKISLYNAATLDLLNRNTSVEGHKLSGIIKLVDKDRKAVNINELLPSIKGALTSREYMLKMDDDKFDDDDEYINIYLNINPVYTGYGHTEERSYIVLLRDITKEKSLEEERDEFISVVSHELRTPIAIAEGNVGNAQFIAEKENANKTIQETLGVAHQQILFLSDLLNDLSTLSRAERGKLEVTLESIDIRHLLDDLLSTYLPDAAKKGLKLSVKHDKKLPKITNSELYVREILQNFITNAIKYTAEGKIEIIATPNGTHDVDVSIKDTGIGMSTHDLKHIFEKFYRSEDYRTRQSSGTGLGLYVTKKLIEMTHSTLDVQSKLNHGSTFTITLTSLSPEDQATKESSEAA